MSTQTSLYKQQIIIILILITFSSVFLAYGLISHSFTMNNTGYVKSVGVEVYLDAECTNLVSTIDWGYIPPGGTQEITVYIRNNGTVPVTLSHSTTNWTPSEASNYIAFSWDVEGNTVNANQVIQATLQLTVDENISGISNFSFDLTIIGTEIAG